MDRILCWNVRGINRARKQEDVRNYINKLSVGLFSLPETKVKISNLGNRYQRMFVGWCFTSNSSYHKGGRIIVAWKAGSFNVNIISASSQFIHCYVKPLSALGGFFCTFIYAYNDGNGIEELWRDLRRLRTEEAWMICGDLNCVLNIEERIGSLVRENEIREIRECMHECELVDIKSVGNLFTWNNKQEGIHRVFSKMDRVMANPSWLDAYSSAEVCFQEEGKFDHTRALIRVYPRESSGVKPFRYYTM